MREGSANWRGRRSSGSPRTPGLRWRGRARWPPPLPSASICGKVSCGGVVGDDSLVAHPFEQVPSDPVVEGRDQGEPGGRQPGREQGHSHHEPPQSLGPGVGPHHAAVRDPIGSPDLVDGAALGEGHVQGGQSGSRARPRRRSAGSRLSTQRGVSITGSRSTNPRIISNEIDPLPRITEARNSIVSAPLSQSRRPTSCRLARWEERTSADLPSPPR